MLVFGDVPYFFGGANSHQSQVVWLSIYDQPEKSRPPWRRSRPTFTFKDRDTMMRYWDGKKPTAYLTEVTRCVFFLNRKVDHLRSFFFQKNILRRWYFSYISFFWPLHQPISASHEKKSWVVDLEDHTVIPSIRKGWWTLLILTRALCWSWWAMH